jgi:hypothetical protein
MEMVKVQEPGKLTIKEPMEATEQTERCMIHFLKTIPLLVESAWVSPTGFQKCLMFTVE